MNAEQKIQQALRALAEHDNARASTTTNAATLFALRQREQRARRRPYWLAYATGIAATLLIVAFMRSPQPSAPSVTAAVRPSPVVSEPIAEPATPVLPSTRTTPRRRKRPQVAVQEEPQEIVTEFYPLMDGAPSLERGQLLRVVVPASTMHRVGLPINPAYWNENVQADVLIGEEGMARAIRFVSYEK
jgi:hypothetical protein